MTHKKKLIEVALPLEAINKAAAREKSIRHGHPSTLHLWWARRPLAAARAVIFAQMVDDPSAHPDLFKTEREQKKERGRLFKIIEDLVLWENTTNEEVLQKARDAIWESWRRACAENADHPRARELFNREVLPAFHDPFAGGGALPLEAQRLGLESYASDLNPVAVLINKAMIEIPPRFAGKPPVNPKARSEWRGVSDECAALPRCHCLAEGDGGSPGGLPARSAFASGGDVRHAFADYSSGSIRSGEHCGGLDPGIGQGKSAVPGDCTGFSGRDGDLADTLRGDRLVPGQRDASIESASGRNKPNADHPSAQTPDALKLTPHSSQLFSREYKGAQGLAEDVRYYGQWMRDEAEKRIGHLYPKITAWRDSRSGRYFGEADVEGWKRSESRGVRNEYGEEVARECAHLTLSSLLSTLSSHQLTVIAWLWARTVKSPNPAFANVDVPLASTFMLSTKAGKEAYVEPVIEGGGYRFTVKVGKPKDAEAAKNGTKLSRGANFACLMSGAPISGDYIKAEGKAGRMGARLMAIVAEGTRGRVYLAPTPEHEAAALKARPDWRPESSLPDDPRNFWTVQYGLTTYGDLFTDRQLVALTTFSDLVGEAIERCRHDYLAAHSPSPFMERGPGGEVPITGHAHVSPEKLNLARNMRKLPTDAEARAWEMLRDRRCRGLKFRRQQVIQGLIVDFYCAEMRLAIELDGAVHDQQMEYDLERDKVLAAVGVRVVRVSNEELTRERLEEVTSPPGPLSINGEGEGACGLAAGGAGATAYAEAVGVYLGLAISRFADRNNSICTWDSGPVGTRASTGGSARTASLRNLFARHAIPMAWDYGEANPFSDSGGGYNSALEWIEPAVRSLGGITLGVASADNASIQSVTAGKVVSTDPPYYDNISYADLSDFFYVWLRRSLRPVFPDLFATMAVPKAEELVATPYRHGSKQKAETFFLDGMTQAMRRLAEQAHPAYPVTIYYAFKQSESDGGDGTTNTGWDTFLAAVIEAGFAISGTWPMRTELGNRMIGSGTNALASSIVLVCRPRPANAPTATRREFHNSLKTELPAALAHLQAGNIAPVDLAQAAIGPGMAVYTRYAKVLDAEGKPIPVRAALALINQVLDEALAKQEGDFDADTRWALAWFEQMGFAEGEFGVAEQLSKSKNTAVSGLAEAGILFSGKGKVRLLKPAELPADWDPTTDSRLTIWEMVHQLVRVLEAGGESAAAALVAKLGSQAEIARELCYRLYTLCERKKRANEAMAYNGLVQSWPEIVRLAREKPRAATPGTDDLFDQE